MYNAFSLTSALAYRCAVKCCDVTQTSVFGQGDAEEQLIKGVDGWCAFPKDIRRCVVVSDPFPSTDGCKVMTETVSSVGYGMDNATDLTAVKEHINRQIGEFKNRG